MRVAERRPLGLGDLVLQAGLQRFGVVALRSIRPRRRRTRTGRGVQRNGVAAQALLDHPGDDVVVGRLVAAQLLGRLLEALLLQAFQVEGESRLEDFLQEVDEALAAALGVGQAVHRLVQLARRADAHLVPVEEVLAQAAEGPVGLLAGDALAADGVEELLQHRARLCGSPGLGVLGNAC